MRIGEVIRKYRKSKNMTQEEMANRLGVSAPAVNKWENGASCPDITLLSPIARLLGISLDTLLSFQDELTVEEINHIICEMNGRRKEETYENIFQWAKEIIEKYPNCEQLIWQVAIVLDSWRVTSDIPEAEKYDSYIESWYARVLESRDEAVREHAADALFGFYARKEQYEKAEEYLIYFSNQNPEKKRKQAEIFNKTNRVREAYKTYEEILFSGYQMMNMVLHSIYALAMQDDNIEKAHTLVEKRKELAHIFEMGAYHEISCGLEWAEAEKNAEAAAEDMEKLLANIDTIRGFTNSSLYEHMEFKEVKAGFLAELRENLLKNFQEFG